MSARPAFALEKPKKPRKFLFVRIPWWEQATVSNEANGILQPLLTKIVGQLKFSG
jgi:hypothetical protein